MLVVQFVSSVPVMRMIEREHQKLVVEVGLS